MRRYKFFTILILVMVMIMEMTACENKPYDGLGKEDISSKGKSPYFVKLRWDGNTAEYDFGEYESYEKAVEVCERNKVYGCRVFDKKGSTVYYPYMKLQCDILREAKILTDYCRDNVFIYGDAPINPGIDHTAGKVSCDRIVCWVMYNLGYVEQPYTQGVVVSAMKDWCESQGFIKIESELDLRPGDIVLVNPNSNNVAGHTFIHAGNTDTNYVYYRYDEGSNQRINSVQPFSEPINNFMYAYRPVPLNSI